MPSYLKFPISVFDAIFINASSVLFCASCLKYENITILTVHRY